MACRHPHDNTPLPQYKGKEGIIRAGRISKITHNANGGATIECDEAQCSTCGGPWSLFLHKKWLTSEQRQNMAIGSYLAEFTNGQGKLMRAIVSAAQIQRDYRPLEDTPEGGEPGTEIVMLIEGNNTPPVD